MKAADRIVVREAEVLPLPAGMPRRALSRRLFEATSHLPFGVFSEDRRGLRAGNVVGLVDAGTVQVEILPKAGATDDVLEDQPRSTAFLLDVLSYAGVIPRAFSLSAHTTAAPRLLEVVCGAAAHAMLERLVDGVPRRYAERRELSATLRGAPELRSIARRRPGTDPTIPIRHAPLHRENPLTRVIASTAAALAGRTRSAHTWSLLQTILALLDGVEPRPLSVALVQEVRLARGEEGWADVVALARLLCSGQGHSPVSRGGYAGLSVVFPLHDVFEAVLRRALAEALRGSAVELSRQAKRPLLQSVATGTELLPLKPDFVFRTGPQGEIAGIGDAKWKRLPMTDTSHGASPPDVYQLVTYLFRYGTPRGLLFFPMAPWMLSSPEETLWSRRFRVLGPAASTLTFIGVDIAGLVSRDRQRRANAVAALGATVSHELGTP